MKFYLAFIAFSLVSTAALAQNSDGTVDPEDRQFFADSSKVYLVPDIPANQLRWTKFETKWFTTKIGLVALFDYSTFIQDDANEAQVGKQHSKFELRSGRVMFSGDIKFKKPWQYLIATELNGFSRDPGDPYFRLTDLSITIPAGKFLGKVIVGKTKETFMYEMVGDAANLPFMERILNPFFISRNVGVKFLNTGANERMTWSAGWFNNWWATGKSFNESSNQFTARVTGLPLWSNDGLSFLHLGLSTRYNEKEKGVLIYQGRPESNVTDVFVDSEEFAAHGSWSFGSELLVNRGPFSVLGEYAYSKANAVDFSAPSFSGFYVTDSWVLTGEHRPYDRRVGYARRVMPSKKGGAWEVVARYSHLDITDQSVDGGKLNKIYLGVNWWTTAYWRTSFGYGLTGLDKDSLQGNMNSFQVRLQWVH